MALFPLRTVLVPGMPLSLNVFEPRYRRLVADLLQEESAAAPRFGVVALKAGWEVGALSDVYAVGTIARVSEVFPFPDGRCRLEAVGESRFQVVELDTTSQPYLMARIRHLAEDAGAEADVLAPRLAEAIARYNEALVRAGVDPSGPIPTDALELSYAAARQPWLTLEDRQYLLEAVDTTTRLAKALAIVRRESTLLSALHAVPVSADTLRAGFGSR